MKIFIYAILLGLLLSITSCGASWFSCSTEASYNKEGEWTYKSCKNQEDFHARIVKSANGTQTVEVETTAMTAEAAIAQAGKAISRMVDVLSTLIPLLEKAAMTGGS